MNVHVVFASRHGATGEIAEAIAAALRDAGIAAQSHDVSNAPEPVGCDAVVLGSGVYMGRWLPPARRYARAHGSSLRTRPVWLFSSGPVGDSGQVSAAAKCRDGQEAATTLDALDHRVFAGRLDRSQLNWTERAAVHVVGAPDGDYRDWDAIKGFAQEIADVLTSRGLASGCAAVPVPAGAGR